MAGVIKAGTPQAASHTSSAKPYFHLEDLEQQGNQYLDQVRTQADQILENARLEAEKIRQQAMNQGRKDAVILARQELDGELQRKLQSVDPMLQSTLSQLRQELEHWKHQWEHRTVALAVGIAEKVVGRQLQQMPEIVLTQLEMALKLAGKQDQLELRVHPTDLQEFQGSMEKLVERFGDLTTTVIVPDDQVQTGGCVVRTSYGSIDAQLETQIQRIGEELS